MTSFDIQDTLFNHFKTLNTFSGKSFITDKNVSYPNLPFEIPSDKRFFILNFLDGGHEAAALTEKAQDRYNGILQIDICTPLNKGEKEAQAKYSWICKLFAEGSLIDDVEIEKCDVSQRIAEDTYYKTVVRINFTADVNKEI